MGAGPVGVGSGLRVAPFMSASSVLSSDVLVTMVEANPQPHEPHDDSDGRSSLGTTSIGAAPSSADAEEERACDM